MVVSGSLTILPALLDACGSSNNPVSTGPMKSIENVSLVKEQSKPSSWETVYLIVGGLKFSFNDADMFGRLDLDLSKVRVVDNSILGNFTERQFKPPLGQWPSDLYFDCGQDHNDFRQFYYWNCKNSSSIVRKNILVAGWLYENPPVNTPYEASAGVEDVHYNLFLDAVFLDRMYGPNGLSAALNNAAWWGNPPGYSLPFADVSLATPSAPKVVDFNSWFLPVKWNPYDLHSELQAWHTRTSGNFGIPAHHFIGRGGPPSLWVNPLPEDADAWFPFDPRDPEGTGQLLKTGDYLLLWGTLWQDTDHDAYSGPWKTGSTINHTGWAEMHPPDLIMRIPPPGLNTRLTSSWMSLTPQAPQKSSLSIKPDFEPSGPSKMLRLRSVQELIDARVTTGVTYSIQKFAIDKQVEVVITLTPTGTEQAKFKATWLVGWSEIDLNDVVWWVSDQLPPGATPYGDNEVWNWSEDSAFYGQKAHSSVLVSGMHQHYFLGTTQPLIITSSSDTLFAMVYLDPDFPPDEVMLQWHTTDWLSRAYWGDNLIELGTNNTADRHYMGSLPPTGEWVRIEVPATAVGLYGTPQASVKVDGMAFTLFGGSAIWDYAGVKSSQNATYINESMANFLQPGQTQAATVTMKNTGLIPWVAGGNTPYRLGAQNPQDNTIWGLNRIDLPTSVVPPGESVTFNFTVTAPAQPGSYNFQWRMVIEGVEWFGDFTPNIDVFVSTGVPPREVPSLVHKTLDNAYDIAGQAGFDIAIVSRTFIQKLKEAIVISQSPGAGTLAPAGSTIDIGIEYGPPGP
jgi:hypothetical protein